MASLITVAIISGMVGAAIGVITMAMLRTGQDQ
jgi:hypothetical protein